MVERPDCEEVEVDPDGSAPVRRVVLSVALPVERGGPGQRPQAVGRPQLGRVLKVTQDGTLWLRGFKSEFAGAGGQFNSISTDFSTEFL